MSTPGQAPAAGGADRYEASWRNDQSNQHSAANPPEVHCDGLTEWHAAGKAGSGSSHWLRRCRDIRERPADIRWFARRSAARSPTASV